MCKFWETANCCSRQKESLVIPFHDGSRFVMCCWLPSDLHENKSQLLLMVTRVSRHQLPSLSSLLMPFAAFFNQIKNGCGIWSQLMVSWEICLSGFLLLTDGAVSVCQSCSEYWGLLQLHYSLLLRSGVEFWSTLDYLIRDARRNYFISPTFLCVAPFPPVSFVFFSEKVLRVGNCIRICLSFFDICGHIV